MAVICRRLVQLYDESISENQRRLVEQSLTAVAASASKDPTLSEHAVRGLSREWQEVIDNPDEDGPSGWFGLVYTFQDLLGEICGDARQGAALEWVAGAAVDAPDPSDEAAEGAQLVELTSRNLDRADEARSGIQLLMQYPLIAQLAEVETADGICDPTRIERRLSGD